MDLRASIDIGSNSILLLVANVNGDKVDILENESTVTGLGKDLDNNGHFLDSAMDDSYLVLKRYVELCKKHEIDAWLYTSDIGERVLC